ncbi:dTDP-4-dehydrorhamnose reductase [Pantoea coffeiphila]|uniref:dTDP-4-dehydrorhamnose reductase n=1 Tax=Pantoea coffeiphila TaxID=1465635 RepID=A0A2S9IG72_9GAMM|nr:dTDP-4-dehydrorhamnose reductase [Pantoea coffeiphila]PRD16802.1 dTDP-4-dehydrorhamnose reductase [Pantoea coffeiphila]
MKVLLTGSNGQLGKCFQDRFPKGWQINAVSSAELDITDKDSVLSVTAEYKPDVIVNAAAYTAVDKAENEAELATLVNTIGPANLASAAKALGARFIHVSTDYVFDGTATSPYLENDITNPLGVYGKSKLDGELAVAEMLPQSIIVRTAWVFSEYGNNFLKTMLRLGSDRPSLGIVADQYGCPTYAGDIASALITLIEKNVMGGIYHYCGDKSVTWYQFADEIFRQAVLLKKLPQAPLLKAITTEEYPTPAARPAYSTLSTEKIQQSGIQPSDWQKAISHVIQKL